MKVFKFGGASVQDAKGIRNLYSIISTQKEKFVIVVSAFGKTTNNLESLMACYVDRNPKMAPVLETIKNYHKTVATELFERDHIVFEKIENYFSQLQSVLNEPYRGEWDAKYDQIVSFGELLSTTIIASFLENKGLNVKWSDVRGILKTDATFREGKIIWDISEENAKKEFSFVDAEIYVTQGFIASTRHNETTTLGREGSDYTAAVLASMLDAESVTIWKDVPGVLNADPKWLKDVQLLENVSYQEAIELSFHGAKVIHPKTIKPIQNKGIPLYVKSFIDPNSKGTSINSDLVEGKLPPCFIMKKDQVLISIWPKDLSFIMEESLSNIFALLHKYRVKVNLIQNSAVSVSVCVDKSKELQPLLEEFALDFRLKYNEQLELLTIRHYTSDAVERMTKEKEIMLMQKSRRTARFIIAPQERNKN